MEKPVKYWQVIGLFRHYFMRKDNGAGRGINQRGKPAG
jgi:hypothetical protein